MLHSCLFYCTIKVLYCDVYRYPNINVPISGYEVMVISLSPGCGLNALQDSRLHQFFFFNLQSNSKTVFNIFKDKLWMNKFFFPQKQEAEMFRMH